jgi:hypothetical protein
MGFLQIAKKNKKKLENCKAVRRKEGRLKMSVLKGVGRKRCGGQSIFL